MRAALARTVALLCITIALPVQIIAKLDPKGLHEISRTKLIEPTKEQLNQRGGVCWSHPAFANRCVYARNDRELVCADLAAKP